MIVPLFVDREKRRYKNSYTITFLYEFIIHICFLKYKKIRIKTLDTNLWLEMTEWSDQNSPTIKPNSKRFANNDVTHPIAVASFLEGLRWRIPPLFSRFSKHFLRRIVSQKLLCINSHPFWITKRCPFSKKHAVNLKLN